MDERQVGGLRINADGSRVLEITNLAAVRGAIGDEVLVAFCCCFVHADRLTALADFGSMSLKMHGQGSAAHTRNLQAMFWFVAGTLRELALAVRGLRSQLAKRGLLGALGSSWQDVLKVEEWEDCPDRRELRNRVSFHVDVDLVRAGLDQLAAGGTPVIVAAGDGPEAFRTHLPLGLSAVIQGLALPASDLEPLFRSAAEHHGVSIALQRTFMEVVAHCGITPGPPEELPAADPE
jgi:hypothetical protein